MVDAEWSVDTNHFRCSIVEQNARNLLLVFIWPVSDGLCFANMAAVCLPAMQIFSAAHGHGFCNFNLCHCINIYGLISFISLGFNSKNTKNLEGKHVLLERATASGAPPLAVTELSFLVLNLQLQYHL